MRLVWTHPLSTPATRISLAREPGSFLLLDGEGVLSRHNRLGESELRQRAPASLSCAVLSDDGRTLAAGGKHGGVWMMTSDFVPIWSQTLPARVVGLALDHLGERLAAADEVGGVHAFDRKGRLLWRVPAARPLVYLTFVPEAPLLVGSADFGLVCAFDARGRCAWRDGLVAHVGSLAVTGDGRLALLACFTEGLCGYSAALGAQTRLPRAAPSRLAGMSYTGETVVTAGLDRQLTWRDAAGEAKGEITLPAPALAVAVDALGAGAVVLTGEQVMRLEKAPAT